MNRPVIRLYPTLTLVTGLTAMACYLAADDQPLLIAGVAPVAVAAWMLRGSRVAAHIPRLAVNLAVLAAMAYAGTVVLNRGLEVEGVAVLVIILLILKFFDRTTARDYAQILGLSTFLVIAAVLTSARFEMALLLVAFLPLAGAAAMLHQVYAGHEAAVAAARAATPVGAAVRTRLCSGRRAGTHFVRLILASSAAIALLAAVTFVLIPRGIGLDMMGRWSKVAAGSQTRFTPDVKLGTPGFISSSPRIVLYLQVFDSSGISLGGPSAVYHLRGEVLDQYNPQTGMWSRSKQYDKFSRGAQGWAAGQTIMLGEQVDDATVEQRVTLLNAGGDKAFVFTLQRPVKVVFDRDVSVRWNASDRRLLLENETGQIQYRIHSVLVDTPSAFRRSHVPEPEPEGETPAPDVSSVSAAVRALAAEIVERDGVDLGLLNKEHAANAAAARAIERYLRENFTYTTDIEAPAVAEGGGANPDPVEWFLLEHRRGHCEYFASAMAVMCQSLGIRARVIAGYVAAEWSQAADHYIVRESNAHAWVEVEQARNVWRTFDPTPPTDLDRLHRPAPGLLSRARRLFDVVEHAWVSSIVTFDQGSRRRLADRADSGGFDLFRRAQRVTARARSGGLNLALTAAMAGLAAALGAWALLATLGGLWKRAGRVRDSRRRAAARVEGAPTRFYADLLEALRGGNLTKPAWRPPLEHADALRGEHPEVGDATERLARLYYTVRFGHRPLTDAQRGEIDTSLRAVRAGARHAESRPA